MNICSQKNDRYWTKNIGKKLGTKCQILVSGRIKTTHFYSMGFSKVPFVSHLHLHCLSLPTTCNFIHSWWLTSSTTSASILSVMRRLRSSQWKEAEDWNQNIHYVFYARLLRKLWFLWIHCFDIRIALPLFYRFVWMPILGKMLRIPPPAFFSIFTGGNFVFFPFFIAFARWFFIWMRVF